MQQNPSTSSSVSKPLRPQHLKLALRADSGLAVGQVYSLLSQRNIIGRSVEAGIPVDDSKVSRNHAAIDLQNGFHMLVDLGSTNGTFLNGRRVEQSVFLNPGDEIRVGSMVLVVELLEKARYLAGKSWRERTNVMIIPPVAQEKAVAVSGAENPKAPVIKKNSVTRDNLLGMAMPSFASVADIDMAAARRPIPGQNRLSDRQIIYGRWAVALVGLALTAAAIAMRMG